MTFDDLCLFLLDTCIDVKMNNGITFLDSCKDFMSPVLSSNLKSLLKMNKDNSCNIYIYF